MFHQKQTKSTQNINYSWKSKIRFVFDLNILWYCIIEQNSKKVKMPRIGVTKHPSGSLNLSEWCRLQGFCFGWCWVWFLFNPLSALIPLSNSRSIRQTLVNNIWQVFSWNGLATFAIYILEYIREKFYNSICNFDMNLIQFCT